MSNWQVLSRFFVRSAGFPFAIADMRSPALVAALAELGDAQTRLQAQRAQFIGTEFPAAIERQSANGEDRAAFKALYRARRDVERGLPLGTRVDQAPALAMRGATWDRAVEAVAAAERTVEREADGAHAAARAALQALAGRPGFREAVAFSSPGAFERVVARADRPATGARARQRDRLLYAYAQRLATKNETTSWFGPIDYGRVAGGGSALVLEHRAAPPDRWARLTHWSVEAIAAAVCADPAVRDALALKLRPGWYLREPQGALVAAPTGRVVGLDKAELAVLRACERGITPGRLRADASPAALVALDRLTARKIVGAELVVPAAVDDPAEWLDLELSRLADAGVESVTRVRASLRALRASCERFQAARGDERLDRLRELETDFGRVAGGAARRGEGAHYADRLVVTEDCRGDLSGCDLGEDAARTLETRLAPYLSLSATYALLVRDAVAARARDLHARMATGGEVAFLRFSAALDAEVDLDRLPREDLALERWLDAFDAVVVAAVDDDGCARVPLGDIAHLLRPVPEGLLASPDIFALDDPTRAGVDIATLPLLVGELHHGAQVWTHLGALDPELDEVGDEVAAALAADRPGVASLLCRRIEGKAFERELPGTVVELRTLATHPGAHAVRAEALTVDLGEEEPRLRLPTGGSLRLRPRHPRSPTNWLFGPPPLVAPPLLRHASAAPRVIVGDVIAWRQRWTLAGRALDALRAAASPPALVRAADDLLRSEGLSDRVFARARGARKPVYVDLRCPMSLAHFLHHAHEADAVTMTELLPEPERWWLPRDGKRVSCELRFTLTSTAAGGGA